MIDANLATAACILKKLQASPGALGDGREPRRARDIPRVVRDRYEAGAQKRKVAHIQDNARPMAFRLLYGEVEGCARRPANVDASPVEDILLGSLGLDGLFEL